MSSIDELGIVSKKRPGRRTPWYRKGTTWTARAESLAKSIGLPLMQFEPFFDLRAAFKRIVMWTDTAMAQKESRLLRAYAKRLASDPEFLASESVYYRVHLSTPLQTELPRIRALIQPAIKLSPEERAAKVKADRELAVRRRAGRALESLRAVEAKLERLERRWKKLDAQVRRYRKLGVLPST